MSKLVTITVNTSIDYLIEVEDFEPGAAIKALSAQRFAGGGGINVARALATLGANVVTLGFVSENSAEFFEEPQFDTHSSLLTKVTGQNRENITIHDNENNIHFYIQTPGYTVTKDDLHRLNNSLEQFIAPGDWVVISGSLPPGAAKSTEWELVRTCQRLGAIVTLDTSKEDLQRGLDARPYMVKPDIRELEMLTGMSLKGDEDGIVMAASQIARSGVEVVIVSRSAEGVIVVSREPERAWKAKVALTGHTESLPLVGSGDSLVGGILFGLFRKKPLVEALRLGVACGAANLLTVGPAKFKMSDVERISSEIQIEELPLFATI